VAGRNPWPPPGGAQSNNRRQSPLDNIITLTPNGIFFDDSLINNVFPHLSAGIEVEDGCQLKTLLSGITNDPDISTFYDVVFYHDLGGFPLAPFLDEVEMSPTRSDTDEPTSLEFRWAFDEDTGIWPQLVGISNDGQEYSLSFMSLRDLAPMPISIIELIEINGVEFTQPFRLFDILSCLFNEISFHGLPAQRDETKQSLRDAVANLKKEYPHNEMW
jgi:hypothetical protein